MGYTRIKADSVVGIYKSNFAECITNHPLFHKGDFLYNL